MTTQRYIAFILGFLGVGFSPYRTDSGVIVRWYKPTVTVVYESQGTPDVAETQEFVAIRAAMQTWNEVPCAHPILEDGGTVHGKMPREDQDLNLLYFWQDAEGWNKEHADVGSTVIALTTLYYDPNTGAIHNFDMEFADFSHDFTVTDIPWRIRYDLQAICTHEFGHALGLDHSTDPTATMYPKMTVGDTSMRSLARDDISGLCSVYGAQWSAPVNDSAAREGGGCRASATTLTPWFFLPVLLLLFNRGKRRVFFAIMLGLISLNFKPITSETGNKVKWGFGHVTLQLDLSQSHHVAEKDARKVVSTALSVWNDIPCNQPILDSTTEPSLDSVGTIIFQDLETYVGPSVLGLTELEYDVNSGFLSQAKISFNTKTRFSLPGEFVTVDFASVVVHELGHLLGLDHTNVFEATMFPYYYSGTTWQRDPSEDDMLGICDIYGGTLPEDYASLWPWEDSPNAGCQEGCAPLGASPVWVKSNRPRYSLDTRRGCMAGSKGDDVLILSVFTSLFFVARKKCRA